MKKLSRVLGYFGLISLFFGVIVHGQEPQAPGVTDGVSSGASAPRLVKFGGTLKDATGQPLAGVVGVTFALYKDQQGGTPLWLETQNVSLDLQGSYTALLGSTQSDGMPLELFTSGESRWIGVQTQLPGEIEQPRVLLVSVPYALKAADADTLGGKPLSAFLLAPPPSSADSGKRIVSQIAASMASTTTTASLGGTGTLNKLAKWTDNSGTLGDSVVTETGGLVGIGTTSPVGMLTLFNSGVVGNGAGLLLDGTTVDNAGGIWFKTPTNGYMMGIKSHGGVNAMILRSLGTGIFFTDSSGVIPLLTQLEGGNVGVGTQSPSGNFHVTGDRTFASPRDGYTFLAGGSTFTFNSTANVASSLFLTPPLKGAGSNNPSTAAASLYITDEPTWSGSTTAALYVLNGKSYFGGNVGIGTTTPGAKLDVAGNINTSGTVTANLFSGSGASLTSLNASSVSSGTLGLANGGTGQTTLTNHGVLLGQGSSAIGAVAAMAADTLLQGQGASADPSAVAVNNCGDSSHALSYNTTTHSFGCQAITGGGTVTAVSASGPLASSGGTTPNISLTGTVAIANGGTGATTASSALTALGGASLAVANTFSAPTSATNTFTAVAGGVPQTILTGDNANKGVIVKANSATQSANLQEWQDSAGNAQSAVNPSGAFLGPLGFLLPNPVSWGAVDGIDDTLPDTSGGSSAIQRAEGVVESYTDATALSFDDTVNSTFANSLDDLAKGLNRPGAYFSARARWISTIGSSHVFYVLAGGPSGGSCTVGGEANCFQNGFGFKAEGSVLKGFTMNGGSTHQSIVTLSPSVTLTTNGWVDLLAVRRGTDPNGTIDFYVNGVFRGSSPTNTNLPSTAYNICEVRTENGAGGGTAQVQVAHVTVGLPMK